MPTARTNLQQLEPLGRIHFIYVGRYHVNKGPDLLLEALTKSQSRDSEQGVRTCIWSRTHGERTSFDTTKRRTRRCRSIHGPIQAQEFSDMLARVSFLVIPSRIESIPVVFSDAVSSGVPMLQRQLATLVNSFRAIMRHRM